MTSTEAPGKSLLPASEISAYSLQPTANSLPSLHVVAGALFDEQGRILVAERLAGKHMAGRWEFPGGKVAMGETPLLALGRELLEELGIAVNGAEPIIRYGYEYPDRHVLLDLWHITQYSGIPRGREGQRVDWVRVEDLRGIDLLEADRPMIGAIEERLRAAGCGLRVGEDRRS